MCAYPVGPLFNSMNPGPFYRALDKASIPSQSDLESLDAVEDLLMVGYPNALWDEINLTSTGNELVGRAAVAPLAAWTVVRYAHAAWSTV